MLIKKNPSYIERWAFDQSIIGIISADKELNILFINSWVEDFCQLNADDVFGKNLYDVFPDLKKKNIPQKIDSALNGQTSILSHKFHKYIIPIHLSASEYSHLEFMQQSVTISPLVSGETVDGITIIIQDVTDRVSKEMELSSRIQELESIQKSLQQSEQELKESNQLNQSMLSSIPFGMDIIDEERNILFQSDNLQNLFAEDSIGKKCWELYCDNKSQCFDCPLNQGVNIGKTGIYEVQNIFGGRIFEIHHTGMIFQGKRALLKIFIDITSRKRNELEIEKNTRIFKNLIQASNEIIQLPDINSIYRYICNHLQKQFTNTITLFVSIDESKNETELIEVSGLENTLFQKAQKLIGYGIKGEKFKLVSSILPVLKTGKITEFKGGLAEFSSGEFPEIIANTIQKLLKINKIYTIGILNNEELLGAIHFFTLNESVISDFDYVELFVKQAGLHIQTKLMQLEVNQSEEKFRTIFEESPIGIALIDSLTGHIYEFNSRFAEIAGRTIKEMANINWMSITHPDDIQEDLDNMALMNAGKTEGFTMDKRYIKADGSEVWINMTVAKISVNKNVSSRHLAMIKDITERRQNQIVLENYANKLQQTNAEKDKFFSIIAHDLRSPFNGLLGLTEYMSENVNSLPNNKIQEIADSLRNSTVKVNSLLENLLEWSRMKRGLIGFDPEIQNLTKLADEIISGLEENATNKKITIVNSIPGDILVFADKNMLSGILRNLASNSLKFTLPGGSIQFAASMENDLTIRISISDTGIGMKKEILDNLFRLDVNVSRPGTEGEPSSGLGLLLCKEFVEKHGGKIWAESEEGKGSVFSFLI